MTEENTITEKDGTTCTVLIVSTPLNILWAKLTPEERDTLNTEFEERHRLGVKMGYIQGYQNAHAVVDMALKEKHPRKI